MTSKEQTGTLTTNIICLIDNIHTPTAHSECFVMIGMMNEHITAPIISGILKHAYSKHKQTHRAHYDVSFIRHLIIKHINRVYVHYKKKTLFIIAAANRLALMTAGNDGEEAS